MATTELSKARVEEEGTWLKWELKQTMSDFAKEKRELEVTY